MSEITQLKKLPSIQFLLEKLNEVYEYAEWLYDYFGVQSRLQKLITLIKVKLLDAGQNALDAENRFDPEDLSKSSEKLLSFRYRYREAKTKFIFEPADGVMYLEQKLPMSWHAFNETPKFDVSIPPPTIFSDHISTAEAYRFK